MLTFGRREGRLQVSTVYFCKLLLRFRFRAIYTCVSLNIFVLPYAIALQGLQVYNKTLCKDVLFWKEGRTTFSTIQQLTT